MMCYLCVCSVVVMQFVTKLWVLAISMACGFGCRARGVVSTLRLSGGDGCKFRSSCGRSCFGRNGVSVTDCADC